MKRIGTRVTAPYQLYALGLVLPVFDLPAHRFLSYANAAPDFTIDPDDIPPGLDSPCWRWRKKKLRGYGQLKHGYESAAFHKDTNRQAHRFYYEMIVGPIPKCRDGFDQHLDHLCRNKDCVNPAHTKPKPAEDHGRMHAEERWEAHRARQDRTGEPDFDDVPF